MAFQSRELKHNGRRIWHDAAKTKAELKPARLIHRAWTALTEQEKERQDPQALEKVLTGKQVKKGRTVLAFSLNSELKRTAAAKERYGEDQCDLSIVVDLSSIHLVCWNAECKCNSEASLETIVACVETSFPNWDVLFLSESDSVSSSSFEISHPRFQIFRHWPGEGSRSMSFVVRSCLRSLSFAVRARNRVLSLEMWADQRRDSTSLLMLSVHGPHSDLLGWHDFCGDFIDLISSRARKGSVVAVGDWNADYGPTFDHYPVQSRQDDHMS